MGQLDGLVYKSPYTRWRLAGDSSTDVATLGLLARDREEGVRLRVAQHPAASASVLAGLADDSSVYVRSAVARHVNTPQEALRQLVACRKPDSARVRAEVAAHPNVPLDVLQELAVDEVAVVRVAAATNFRLPVNTLLSLVGDPSEGVQAAVRQAAFGREDVPDHIKATIALSQ